MGLKDKLVYWQLTKRLATLKRSKRFFNLETAKTAGIIWNCGDRAAFERLSKTLSQKQIKVTDLCYSQGSSPEAMSNMFGKNDFNFWGIPKNEVINNFINKEFDILIDISMSSDPQILVVRALSQASFKTGWSESQPDFFDLSIDISKNKESSFLVDQLLHYLSEIK